VVFAADKTVLCQTGNAIKFSNSSTGPADITFAWDLGDVSTSIEKEPAHVYINKGTYTVKLSVNSASGCAKAEEKKAYINVADFTTDFTVPALVCQNTRATFTPTSTPTANYAAWYIDGQLNYNFLGAIEYTFSTDGPHKVRLVNTFGNCQNEVTKDITVRSAPKLSGFIVETNGVCGAPVNVQFKDTTATAVKWMWSYYPYNTSISTVKEPLLNFDRDGSFYLGLKVTDATGCNASTEKYITIARPNIYINGTALNGTYTWGSGCEGLTMKFNCSEAESISEYKWNLGDGTTSSEAQPTHTYVKAGNYNVKVSYVTKAGCKGEAFYSTSIEVFKKPTAEFTSANGTTICGNTPVTFKADNENFSTGFVWLIDGIPAPFWYGSSLIHQFSKDTTFTISLIANNGNCRDTITKKDYIKLLPPFPKIDQVVNTCNDTRGLVTFSEKSFKALQWKWDFGDGSPEAAFTTAPQTVSHLYTKTGQYKVVLTTTNGQCTVKDSVTTYVYLKQKPLLSATVNEICAIAALNVTISNFEENLFPNAWYYYHSIASVEYGDGTLFSGSQRFYPFWESSVAGSLEALQTGKKDIRIITRSGYFGCADTTNYLPLKIKGPIAGYEILNNNGCFKNLVIFKDTSKATNNTAITKWEWNFGSGAAQTVTNNNPISIRYANPGSYYTQLKITDAEGCSVTTYNNYVYATVNGPQASFVYSPSNVQPGAMVNFYNNTNTFNSYNTQYKWLFKDGTTSTDYNTTKFYPVTGTDTVRLIAQNIGSLCIDTVIKVITIKNVSASFTFTSSYINNNSCPPVIIRFNNTSQNVSKVSWNFGDGSRTENQNVPSHTYYKPGVYLVTLYATSSTGITDSITDSITVKGPYAILKANRLTGCGSQVITLSAEVKNATSYTWDFADGELKTTSDTFAVHTYTVPGIYTPSLILKDAGGCSATSDLPDKIVIDTLNVSFTKNPLQVCDSGYVTFTPVIISLAADQLQQPLQYQWNFGTGNSADTANTNAPFFYFNKTGKYQVSVAVSSAYGCFKQTVDTLLVVKKTGAAINGATEICEDNNALFTGSATVGGSIGWQWNFGNGNNSMLKNPAAQLYSTAGTYQVQLIANNSGCYDTAIINLVVHAKPNINLLPKNTTICLGKSIQLNANGGILYQWSNNAGLSNYTIASPVATPTVSTQYFVEATNVFGCKNNDTATVNVARPFTLKVPLDTFVCRGNSAQLYATGAATYQWINNTVGLSNPAVANPVATPLTASTYTVVGYDVYQCFTDTAVVKIGVQPFPLVSAGPDVQVQTGTQTQLKATGSSDVTKWKWSPADYLSCTNCADPISKPRSAINYVVTSTTKFGCSTSDTMQLSLVCAQSNVYIPTAFTPNRDFKNDVFYIKGGGVKKVNFFRIYSRTGGVVFERTNFLLNDPSAGWNGMMGSYEANPGTYVYFTEMVCDTGEVFYFKGTVVVIK